MNRDGETTDQTVNGTFRHRRQGPIIPRNEKTYYVPELKCFILVPKDYTPEQSRERARRLIENYHKSLGKLLTASES